MDLRLDGKVALVTGGGRGIGRGIALALADSGADVSVVYVNDAETAAGVVDAIEGLGRRAIAVRADVGNQANVDALFAAHIAEFGRIDILVNNAGISTASEPLHEMPVEHWDLVLRTNVYGPFYCSRLAARQIIAQGTTGRIINISSVHEEACSAGGGPYCVSKGALRNLTRTMAIELGPFGITVNGIAPGMILTDMNAQAQANPEYLRRAEQLVVARRAGLPADIGAMAVFLASDQASYCTGSTHFVDGGWMLTWPPV